jgi:hypothetical protein
MCILALAAVAACDSPGPAAPLPDAGACPPGLICVPNTTAIDAGATRDLPPDAGPTVRPPVAVPGAQPPSSATVSVLDYDVVEAKESRALQSAVIVSTTPSYALHVHDLVTRADREVPLPKPPLALAVSPDGLSAAVGFDGDVAVVDLVKQTIAKRCSVPANVGGIALLANGAVIVVGVTQPFEKLAVVDMGTCTTAVPNKPYVVDHKARLKLHPSGELLYAFSRVYYAGNIVRCDLRNLSAVTCNELLTFTEANQRGTCVHGWLSGDATRMFTGCGTIYSMPDETISARAAYVGPYVDHRVTQLAFATQAPLAVFVREPTVIQPPQESSEDTVVRLMDTTTLTAGGVYTLPSIPTSTGPRAAHAREVFSHETLQTIRVLVQTGLPRDTLRTYAVATLTP